VITVVAFTIAAASGALARAEAGRRWNRHDGIALGTLVVNVTGSFLLGLLADVAAPTVTVLGVAALGAYTTFSSFARDVVALGEARRYALAGFYVATTYGLGIAAATLGVTIGG
jgi:CrcB protein